MNNSFQTWFKNFFPGKVIQKGGELRMYSEFFNHQTILIMRKLIFTFLTVTLFAGVASAQMEKDVVDIAISSEDHTTLVAAVKAADLVGTLKGEGPFTIFAPTNAAFEALPEGTVASLLKPENKEKLQAVLTYHVVAGKINAADVVKAIKEGEGEASLTTVQGQKLDAYIKGENVYLKDANGNTAKVTATDLNGTNGTIHVIDAVVLPKS